VDGGEMAPCLLWVRRRFFGEGYAGKERFFEFFIDEHLRGKIIAVD
jgi:hypothetical protein